MKLSGELWVRQHRGFGTGRQVEFGFPGAGTEPPPAAHPGIAVTLLPWDAATEHATEINFFIKSYADLLYRSPTLFIMQFLFYMCQSIMGLHSVLRDTNIFNYYF